MLADVGRRAGETEVLVAVGPELLGCVTFVPDNSSPWAELLGPGEAGVRMLAVDPSAQGRGWAGPSSAPASSGRVNWAEQACSSTRRRGWRSPIISMSRRALSGCPSATGSPYPRCLCWLSVSLLLRVRSVLLGQPTQK